VEIKFQELRRFVRDLHAIGMKITSPCHLKKKHFVAHIQAMESGLVMKEGRGAAAKTLQTSHSSISALYVWVGRSSEIGRLTDCVANLESSTIVYEITEDPTPAAKGVDAYGLVKRLTSDPSRTKEFLFGWQIASALYFGLRISEVLRFKRKRSFTTALTIKRSVD
jgi:hypothetical protein